jgi:hypothetical protein
MVPTPQVDHVDVAAYVLGILDEPDEAAFARHFARCQRCRLEYRELADLPMLLDQLKPARTPHRRSSQTPAQPGKRVLGQALSRVGEARRARIRTLWLAAAAVIVLLVAVPLIVLRSIGNGGSQVAAPTVTVSVSPTTTSAASNTGTDVVAGARTVNGENAAAGVKATIGIEPQPWGTKINLELRATTGPLQCELAAVSRSGDVQILLSWQVPAGGVGVPGASPEPLRLQGGAGFSADDIDRFELRRTDGGPNLLNIPA